MKSQFWALKQRPNGTPKASDFELVTQTLDTLGADQILVQNEWLTVDPYMRGRMNDVRSYVPPFAIGEPMDGGALGRVVKSNAANLPVGSLVRSMQGWRSAFIADAKSVEPVGTIDGVGEQAYLGILGMPGLTAYAGTMKILEPKEGQTLFVSGAAGAVGSVVCQIGKVHNCHVVGTAGSDEKCDYLKSIGVDEVINYKTSTNLLQDLLKAAPKGVDMYFDNVGGDHLQAALNAANKDARMALCGMISQYNNTEPTPGPNNLVLMVGKSIMAKGFIVTDYAAAAPEFFADMTSWLQTGKISYTETVFEGIESTPNAFISLFAGANTGKALVKVT